MHKDYRNAINKYIDDEIEVMRSLDVDSINDVMNLLVKTMEDGHTVYIFGNGGSASTASHFQNDFNKGISEHTEKKFNFQCLNDNVALMLAVANDISYDEIFRFQLQGHLKPGDIVIAISGSGNSKNVLNAVEYARKQGNKVVGVYGFGGGKLKGLSDFHLEAKTTSMQIAEDIHMMFDHLMMAIFYKTLCGIDHIR